MNNPPAFPCTGEGHGNPNYWTPGMTLRDWFAGQALVGLLSGQFQHSGDFNFDALPEEAFNVADAMLAARGDA